MFALARNCTPLIIVAHYSKSFRTSRTKFFPKPPTCSAILIAPNFCGVFFASCHCLQRYSKLQRRSCTFCSTLGIVPHLKCKCAPRPAKRTYKMPIFERLMICGYHFSQETIMKREMAWILPLPRRPSFKKMRRFYKFIPFSTCQFLFQH